MTVESSHRMLRGQDGLLRGRVTVDRDDGLVLRGLVLSDDEPNGAHIILASGFGKSIRHSGFLAAHLARCGHIVWRFDFTNHVGESDGVMADAALSSAQHDLATLSQFVATRGDARPIVLIASSLSARAAVKAISGKFSADLALFILPVVNLERTISAATGSDLVAQARTGMLTDQEIDVLGHPMSSHFVHDAISGGFDELRQCGADFALVRCPIAIVAAEDDEWVDVDDIRTALANAVAPAFIHIVKQSGHDSYSFDFMRLVGNLVSGSIADLLKVGDARPLTEQTFSDFTLIIASDKAALSAARVQENT